MYELLKLLHVLGWSSWFGLAVAEAVVGTRVRRAQGSDRAALATAWLRVGRVLLMTAGWAVLLGLTLLVVNGQAHEGGLGGLFRDSSQRYIHWMLALGLVAAALSWVAAGARSRAVAAGNTEGFRRAYGRAAMFSGLASLCLVATLAVVYLRTAV